ncbi:hypothetical protein [Streptomyces geranii]|uniref:hypothetical protein n=1 Tax=Streptomyces geranii TaxID=2058923 RepID=UPI000D042034|nr:hypothetical protein [Streptomyces geranii]
MTTILLAAVLPSLFLTTVASGVYFLVLLPGRWRGPYEEALVLLDSDDRDELERAEGLLGQAVNAGPRGRALSRIRFAQAQVRAMLGTYEPARYGAAATVLGELIAADGRTEHSACLELWLQARLGNHSRVTDLYTEHRRLLDSRPQSRRIAAVSHLQLAVTHWRRRETDGALHHFDRVRELGELTDHIPAELNDLQLAKGVQAVFDGRTDEAREAFGVARKRMEGQQLSTAEAELGLLVCDWPDGEPGQLGQWLAQLADQLERRPPDDEAASVQLRSGIALLRLLALLREWLARPARSGAPSPDDFAEFRRRVDAVRETDPELGDADLVDGLVRYYFALSQPEREQALKVLDAGQGRARAVLLPEVLDLMERERELGGEENALSRYLVLLTEFMENPGCSPESRAQLLRQKRKFERFAPADGLDGEAVPHQRAPVDDPKRRVEALIRRIELIVYPRLRDLPADHPARDTLRELLTELRRVADAAADGAEGVHRAELDLIISTAQLLLPEETP